MSRAGAICYGLNLILAIDVLISQIILNCYPHTASAYLGDNSQSKAVIWLGYRLRILDDFLDWLNVRLPDRQIKWVLQERNHFIKWAHLQAAGRAYFSHSDGKIYYGKAPAPA